MSAPVRRRSVLLAPLFLSISRAAAGVAAADGWAEFHSEHGGFTVLMPPGDARVIEKPPGEMGEITERRVVRFGDSTYLVNLTLFKPDSVDPLSAFSLLKAENLVDIGDGDIVRVERRFELGDNAAVEVVVDRADGRTLSLRAYAISNRIVQTVVLGPKGSDANDDTKRFLDSFGLLPEPAVP